MLKYVALSAILLLPACDKTAHYGAGFIIGSAVTDVTGSRPLGCAAAVVAGAAKEYVDFVPDPFDFAATVAGGCLDHQSLLGPHEKE